ncbi:MAG TPA: hypothetical protein DD381_03670 [Lentisphaeria bacterium]|nr:MAG: hypothetical protein A2X47_09170 [Lentisphaerae bacterium GWF2_38_69]HBM15431.1 hypothetical protein [Lentisphaeria bacterium]
MLILGLKTGGTNFEEIDTESWRKNVDMQLNSYFVFCQKILKQMDVQKSEAIVNIAPIASFLLSGEARYVTGHNLIIEVDGRQFSGSCNFFRN